VEEHEFVRRYPRLWHVADGEAWDGITRHGLLSSRMLVDLYKRDDADELLGQRREKAVVLDDEELGRAVLRDQELADPERLAACLTNGMTVEQWFRMINGFVHLYAKDKQLDPFRDRYRERGPIVVLTFRTNSLVRSHGEFMLLATTATGSTADRRTVSTARGVETFERLRRYDAKRWPSVQEVVVRDAVQNPLKHLESAVRLFPDGTEEELPLERVAPPAPPAAPAAE
jgi:hypothetical protein